MMWGSGGSSAWDGLLRVCCVLLRGQPLRKPLALVARGNRAQAVEQHGPKDRPKADTASNLQ